ncbi:MAG: toll/interleukin-1 receptor domain-containing protein [Gemmatimonadetes bacterium]|nr:toll/interleukin-1 receptor domain-containing protein [Gemmatimonadota bacterium]
MTINDLKKIFLSHKGVDKNFVIDFKKTLEEFGYDPWLDEDAMPAGTTLERGLLQGMQGSCGVVFFITPSFKDEGYLQTEIDYAIQEKRKKEDKFAIITLQFIGDDGKEASIPDLLETYVWKKPKTSLEALREIVRALPIAPGIIDWRDEIVGVVKVPQMKSVSTTLSSEAETLLKVAAAGDGRIWHPRMSGGEIIQASNNSMLPDQDPRTIALWEGGIEDLLRRRYIKGIGAKGEMFEVTREGYAAADELELS